MSTLLVYKIPTDTRSRAQIMAFIAQIDAIINELMLTAMKSVQSGNHAEYELDTGQTRTKVKYTSVASVAQSIEDYERIRKMYENKLNGSTGVVQLMDSRNFNRRC